MSRKHKLTPIFKPLLYYYFVVFTKRLISWLGLPLMTVRWWLEDYENIYIADIYNDEEREHTIIYIGWGERTSYIIMEWMRRENKLNYNNWWGERTSYYNEWGERTSYSIGWGKWRRYYIGWAVKNDVLEWQQCVVFRVL